jgi:Putative zinc-finger
MTMNCDRKNMQELLPAYLEGTLSAPERARLEAHLAGCSDCAAELNLLRIMAAEPVPDPGETFWESFPEKVHREVWHRRRPWHFRPGDLFRGATLPRWGWAAGAAAAVILTTWLLARPVPPRDPSPVAKHRPAPAVDIIQEAANSSEVRPEELERLSAWAREELRSFQDGLTDLSAGGSDALLGGALNVDVEDELASLSEEQLEVLIDSLEPDVPDEGAGDPEAAEEEA